MTLSGDWGEGSPDVDRLLGILAETGSQRHWRAMRARHPDEAKGALALLLRRRWAMTALRENARLKLERLEYVGRGAAAAAGRSSCAAEGSAALTRRAACSFWRGPTPSRMYGD